MKKTLFLLLSILLIKQVAFSQTTFGFDAGGNLAYQRVGYTSLSSTKEHLNTSTVAGGQFGIFYKLKMNKHLTLASELNFSLIGARQEYISKEYTDSSFEYHKTNQRLGYIEVPVTLQYNIGSFYVGAGPGVSFKVYTKGIEPSYNAIFQTVDVSANLLAGYKITKKWDINARYTYGLLDITKAGYEYYYGGTKQTLNNRFVSLVLLYDLK